MKIIALTEIGAHRPLCVHPVRIAAVPTRETERRAYRAKRAGHPIDQCGMRGDFVVENRVLCRQHAGHVALQYVLNSQGEK